MAAPQFTDFLPQETLDVGGEEYVVTAMSATDGLLFMEKYQADMDSGKSDLKVMKGVIMGYVTKDNKMIDAKRFDILFARKYMHLQQLYAEVIKYNFADVFQAPGTEEQ